MNINSKQRPSMFRRGFGYLGMLWLLACTAGGLWLIAKSQQPSGTEAPQVCASPAPILHTKNIEDVKVGDYVLAKDPAEAGPPTPHRVMALPRNHTEKLVRISVEGGGGLEATPTHPFWIEGSGWTPAGNLRAGDRLLDDQGHAVVVAQASLGDCSSPTYNLTVDGTHTYYVVAGQIPVLVHNLCDIRVATQEQALRVALERYGAVNDPALIEVEEVYGKNANLLGPNGEPYEIVHAIDPDGNLLDIQHHKWGHTFTDVDPPMIEDPHYHGPTGEHIFYGN